MTPDDPSSRRYDDLTPQAVLQALDAVGLHGDGRVLQLNSYENRVFQVFLEDGSAVVAKFYRPGRWRDEQILEEHAFALELAAEEVPVVAPCLLRPEACIDGMVTLAGEPPTLARLQLGGQAHRFAVSPRCAGREPELEDPEVLRQIGRFLGRLHAVGARHPFSHRTTLEPAAVGERVRRVLLQGEHLPEDLRAAWDTASQAALQAVGHAFDALPGRALLRLHGDCHLGNVLWRNGAPHVVDLDDACNGPAVQDVWMLVSGDASTMAQQLGWLLEGYEQFRRFDRRELSLIEPLRTLRMLHHSAWVAERWSDPAFPASFPWFGTPAYWSQQVTQLREQLSAMAEPPLQA